MRVRILDPESARNVTASGSGTLVAGTTTHVSLASARASALAVLLLATSSTPVPFQGGTLVAFPFVFTSNLVTSGAGAIDLPFAWPAGVPSGAALWFQYGVQDAAAIHGVALGNGLRADVP